MDPVYNLIYLATFLVPFALGYRVKKFWTLLPAIIFGALATALNLWVYLKFGEPKDVGLGIIGILPAVIIILGVIHTGLALFGTLAGVIIGRLRVDKQ